MDSADKTMMDNIEKKFGKPFEDWIELVKKEKLKKHGEILKFLKEEHGFTHGYATMVSLKARGTDAGSAESPDQLIVDQYKGKESLKSIYDKIIKEISKFGNDVEIVPKKAAVSLRRKRQFALVQPSTKTRIDLGLKLKDKEVQGRLEGSGPFGIMCTHRVKISEPKDIDKEVLAWLKEAYEKAG
jgi:predicted transport protein